MSYALQHGGENRLLAGLPSEDAGYLASISRFERPSQGRTLTTGGTLAGDVWFPHTGVIALISTDATGRSVQTGVVGHEGGIGLEAVFGATASLADSVVQIEGMMSVIPVDALRSALRKRPAIQMALARFLCALSAQSLQTVACNRLHSLVSRCSRWLLTLQDRVDCDDLPLTQENLARLLGGGRPRINGLLAHLEGEGLIHRRRGRIRLLSRGGLEALACECYEASRSSTAIALSHRPAQLHCLIDHGRVISGPAVPSRAEADFLGRRRASG